MREHQPEILDHEIELSIVIVSWNVADLLQACLNSILENILEMDNYEVFLVDNHSSDESVEMARKFFPWVKLLENQHNFGFAAANNQALHLVKGKYILLLNPDTIVCKGALRTLITQLEKNPGVGVVGPRLVHPDGKTQNVCARRLPTLTNELLLVALPGEKIPWLGKFLQKKLNYPYDYDQVQEVEAISGAATLFRKSLLDSIGLLDEAFFYCGEDIEFYHRVLKTGLKIQYVPAAEIIHYGGQSSTQVYETISVNALMSIQNYYRKTFGDLSALLYEYIMRYVHSSWLYLSATLRLVGGSLPLDDFKARQRIAGGIRQWRYLGSASSLN